jgi:hypothetical protein
MEHYLWMGHSSYSLGQCPAAVAAIAEKVGGIHLNRVDST